MVAAVTAILDMERVTLMASFLEHAESHNLVIANTVFRKRDPHLEPFYAYMFCVECI